jgi:hypothetical protein
MKLGFQFINVCDVVKDDIIATTEITKQHYLNLLASKRPGENIYARLNIDASR